MQKRTLFAIESVVKDVSLSQSGCEVGEDGMVMIYGGASVRVVQKIDSSEIRWFSSSPRCRRKDTLRLRKASNLAEGRKQSETVRLPCGGGDAADPECQLPV